MKSRGSIIGCGLIAGFVLCALQGGFDGPVGAETKKGDRATTVPIECKGVDAVKMSANFNIKSIEYQRQMHEHWMNAQKQLIEIASKSAERSAGSYAGLANA
ncbi:MAG: hypothetical protein C4B58_06890 [Deltaproteobacteria bacterium]|nr:MAG: hypothetical protein C4B58_06890 [Deltaproteobacteria bacterium]